MRTFPLKGCSPVQEGCPVHSLRQVSSTGAPLARSSQSHRKSWDSAPKTQTHTFPSPPLQFSGFRLASYQTQGTLFISHLTDRRLEAVFERNCLLAHPSWLVTVPAAEGHCDYVLPILALVSPLSMQGPMWLFLVFLLSRVAVRR